jgi:hypothetical protein
MGHAVDLQEFFDDLGSKSVSSPPRGEGELVSFGVRIGPY